MLFLFLGWQEIFSNGAIEQGDQFQQGFQSSPKHWSHKSTSGENQTRERWNKAVKITGHEYIIKTRSHSQYASTRETTQQQQTITSDPAQGSSTSQENICLLIPDLTDSPGLDGQTLSVSSLSFVLVNEPVLTVFRPEKLSVYMFLELDTQNVIFERLTFVYGFSQCRDICT